MNRVATVRHEQNSYEEFFDVILKKNVLEYVWAIREGLAGPEGHWIRRWAEFRYTVQELSRVRGEWSNWKIYSRSHGGQMSGWVNECKSTSCSPEMGKNKPDLPPPFIGRHHHSIPSQRKPPEVLAPLSPPHPQTAKDQLRHLHHQPGRTWVFSSRELGVLFT